LWDLPTRLFHWLLVGGIGFSWFTAEVGGNWMEWQERSGMFFAGLAAVPHCVALSMVCLSNRRSWGWWCLPCAMRLSIS
jgi:cytochrome b